MLWGDGFEIETLINCRFAAAGATITEVPSVERDRIYGRSNLHAVSDGLRVLRTLRAEYARSRAAALDNASTKTTALASLGPWRTRVGMIATRCQPEIGGIESHVAEVAGRLVAHGYELEILTTDRSGGPAQGASASDEGYVVRRFRAYPAGRDWYFSPGLFLAALRARGTTSCTSRACTRWCRRWRCSRRCCAVRPYLLTFHTGGNSSAFREKVAEHPVADPGAAAAAGGPADRRLASSRGAGSTRCSGWAPGHDHRDPQRRLAPAGRRAGHAGSRVPVGSQRRAGSSATRATTGPIEALPHLLKTHPGGPRADPGQRSLRGRAAGARRVPRGGGPGHASSSSRRWTGR